MDQKTVTQLIASMKRVLDQERDVLTDMRSAGIWTPEAQLARAQAMHDGFASTLHDLATDTGAARIAVSMLGEYPR
jgi:hypothetical protein